MTSPQDAAAQPETPEIISAIAAAIGSDPKPDEQVPLHDLGTTGATLRPVEDLHSLLLRVSHHLDFETSERTTIYHRLRVIDEQTKKIIKQTRRRRLRAFARYLVAICIGAAGLLAWQSYGEATKQVIAARAPDLGWSPESKQMIAGFVQQLGWTKPPSDSEALAEQKAATQAPQAAAVAQPVAATAAAAPAIEPEQIEQITQNLAALRQSLDQIAANQNQMAGEVARLQSADLEILQRIPAPPPPPAIAPARKPTSVSPPPRAPIPAH